MLIERIPMTDFEASLQGIIGGIPQLSVELSKNFNSF